jgi:phosphatidylglycerophosphatase A
VGLLIGWGLLRAGFLALALGVLAATAAGLWAIPRATGIKLMADGKGTHDDPGWVVIDEIAGQMLCMLALHRLDMLGLAMTFVLFRFFDVLKPGPIGWADRQGGALGIMADDVLAGAAGAIALIAIQAGVEI